MKDAASRTARGVALLRAIEMTRPGEERISSDPIAVKFVSPLSVLGMRAMSAIGLSRLIGIEAMATFALLRERFVEDLMRREALARIEQIVVLGAGFDTRVYRMPELRGVPVYEVDHPSTQAAKQEALRAAGQPLGGVKMVAVDFDRDDLGDRLRSAGYDPAKRTLFVWQGVVMYLTVGGVDATLRFIASNAAQNSVLVFDYLRSDALTTGSPLKMMTSLIGEKLTFTLDTAALPSFLAERGLEVVDVVGDKELSALYLHNSRRTPPAPGALIAVARVPGRG